MDMLENPVSIRSTCIFPKKLLRPGRYHVSIGIFGKPREDVEEEHVDVISFDISDANYVFSSDPRIRAYYAMFKMEYYLSER